MPREAEDWDNGSGDTLIPPKKEEHDHDEDSADEPLELSDDDKKAAASFEGCREACRNSTGCMQFTYRTQQCGLRYAISLGEKQEEGKGVASGWDIERIEAFRRHHVCAHAVYNKEWSAD